MTAVGWQISGKSHLHTYNEVDDFPTSLTAQLSQIVVRLEIIKVDMLGNLNKSMIHFPRFKSQSRKIPFDFSFVPGRLTYSSALLLLFHRLSSLVRISSFFWVDRTWVPKEMAGVQPMHASVLKGKLESRVRLSLVW